MRIRWMLVRHLVHPGRMVGNPSITDCVRFAPDSLVTRQSGQRDCNYLTLIRYIE
jgi:hypothetical protein